MATYVNFNHVTKHIEITKTPVLEGSAWVIDIDFKVDVYSEGKEDWKVNTDLQKFVFPVSSVGGEPLPGSKKLGSTFFIAPDWKIKPYEGDHTLRINGNIYSEDGQSPYVGTTGTYNVMVINSVSNLVDSTVQQLKEIEFATFQNNSVWLDVGNVTGNAISGTAYPAGNREYPSNNIDDMFTVLQNRGLNNISVIGSAVFDTGHNLIGHTVYGENPLRTDIQINNAALASNVEFIETTIVGTLDGGAILRRCLVGTLVYFNGYIIDSVFDQCTIYLDGNADAKFMNCQSQTNTQTTIDLGGSGQDLSIDEYFGHLIISNFSGTDEHIHINMKGGTIVIDSTCTSGTIILSGYANLTDNSGPGLTIQNELISTTGSLTQNDIDAVVSSVWSEDISAYSHGTSAAHILYETKFIERAVFVDTEQVTNGDGSAGNPYNNFNDAKNHAEEHGFKVIITYSELILTSNCKNFTIRGIGAPVVDLNGQICDRTEIFHATIRGTPNNTKPMVAQQCAIDNGASLFGFYENCAFYGDVTIIGDTLVKNCSSGIPGTNRPTFSMNTTGAVSLSVRAWTGGFILSDCNQPGDVVTIEAMPGRVLLDSSNTDGLISVRGIAYFEDQSNGSIVDTTALIDPSKGTLTTEQEQQLFNALTKKQFIGLSE